MKGILLHKWGIGILLLCLFTAGAAYFGAAADRLLLGFMEPFVRMAHTIGNAVFQETRIVRYSFQSAEDIRILRVKNSELMARVAALEYVQRDNKKLVAALGRETEQTQFIVARVTGRSPSLLDDYLIIDAGNADGIHKGAPVLIDGLIHIGTVVETAKKSSTVRLLSHEGEKVEIYFPEANVSSVAMGKGAGLLETQVPESITVREGEPLFSVGPPDFMIGYVEQVARSDTGPFHVVRLNHPISLTDVRMVFVIK